MGKYLFICFALIGLLVAGGCNKQSGPDYYTFVNQTNQLIKIDIYRTHADFIEAAYPVVSGSILPNSSYSVPVNVLSDSRDYYADWYSENFDYGNWGDSEAQVKFTATDRSNFYITSSKINNSRKLCLSGNSAQTTWVAIDAVNETDLTTSIWTSLADSEKYCRLVLTRRYNCMYDYATHVTLHDTLGYSIHKDASGIHILLADSLHTLITSSSAPAATPNSIDSAWLYTHGRRYLMIKQ